MRKVVQRTLKINKHTEDFQGLEDFQRLDTAEQRIAELEYISTETSKTEKAKRTKTEHKEKPEQNIQ